VAISDTIPIPVSVPFGKKLRKYGRVGGLASFCVKYIVMFVLISSWGFQNNSNLLKSNQNSLSTIAYKFGRVVSATSGQSGITC
jgi:hypothetical protein